VWLSHTVEAEPLEEWIDASIGLSDHVLVTVRVEGQVTEESKRQRKVRWKRVNQEWKTEGSERWRKWRSETDQLLAGEMWSSWKRTFENEAVKHIGRERQKLKKHHEGEWSEEVRQLVVLRDKLRKEGKSVSWVRAEIRREKERARDRVRRVRNENLQNERRWNPRGYWSKVNQMTGQQKRTMPSVVTDEGKELEGKEKMKALEKMFQGDQMQPVEEGVERWIRARNQESWAWTKNEYNQDLDGEIRWEEVKGAIKRLKTGKAPG